MKGATLRLPDYGAIAAAKPLFQSVVPTGTIVGDAVGGALSQFANMVGDNQAQKQSMLQFANTLKDSDPDTANVILAAANSINPFSKDATGHTGMMMQLMMKSIEEKNREKHDLKLQTLMLEREKTMSDFNHSFQLSMLGKEFDLKSVYEDKKEANRLATEAAKAKDALGLTNVKEEGKNTRQQTGIDSKEAIFDKKQLQQLSEFNQTLAEKQAENQRKALKDATDSAMKQSSAKIPRERAVMEISKNPAMNSEYAKARKQAASEDKDTAKAGAERMNQIEEDAKARIISGGAATPTVKSPADYLTLPK